MPRKSSKPDDPEQSKRFIETAEEVGADTDDEALERAFKRVLTTRTGQRHRQTDTKTKTDRNDR
jgi:hypothetical protein